MTIKNCPFCGGKVNIENIGTKQYKYYMIQCKNDDCSASVCFGDRSEDPRTAIEVWNRRTVPSSNVHEHRVD